MRPIARPFAGPTLVTTGFSGTTYGRPVLPVDQRAGARAHPDYRVIDLHRPIVTLTNIEGLGHAMNADEVTRPAEDLLFARQIGQVFGVTPDDDATAPKLYLAATSAFGLQIVGPDTNADQLPDRLTGGNPAAQWMSGQWGHDPLSGPGTIWRVDGLTGQVAIFTNLTDDGPSNAGPGLGNLAYDASHDQLFASDLATGRISRLDLRGRVQESFDHGLTARPTAGLAPRPHVPSTCVSIVDAGFDALMPSTWGFAVVDRRVWGVTVAERLLFYAVVTGIDARPEVWSVGLDLQTGAVLTDPRWEPTLAADLPAHETSDIGFAPGGALVVTQRGTRPLTYAFTRLAEMGATEVIRYVREYPKDDPATPSVWQTQTAHFAVGFALKETNGTGGLAFGPGYDVDGFLIFHPAPQHAVDHK